MAKKAKQETEAVKEEGTFKIKKKPKRPLSKLPKQLPQQ